ncbi:MAG: hypothetical protein A3I61_01415 [Acidobacteria bacterium RIFCSPLOWO2_02_FULL_68_18]|nr:MAG: hypothetical protein A3I61_01415 [Acidobacteria bacterium RIFCSPLOWO2_02_FULL_68_18]OFW51572.1 MAG: hypothetical protein A3G77_18810 [Acidobacteria bacterium RIFCSPLOWO2_12_FULL_68_19]
MATLVVTLIVAGTLAFGAVYPWAYLPLFAAAALIGAAGLRRGLRPTHLRFVGLAASAVCAAIAVQLLPLPPSVHETLTPRADAVLAGRDLAFGADPARWRPLSIDPAATQVALLAAATLGLYLVGLPALLGRDCLRSVPARLAVFAIPLALFGIYTREYNNGLLYGFWQPQDGGGSNQAGPFVNRNHFAGWMLMTSCVLIGWLFGLVERASPDNRGRRGRRLSWLSSAEANTILLTTVVVLTTATSVFWSLSRSGIIAFTTSTSIFAWLTLTRRRLDAGRRRLAVAALAIALTAGVSWRGADRLISWFQDNASFSGRLEAWRDGLDLIRDFPVTGTGLNTYPTAMLFYQTRNRSEFVAQAHNDYLQLVAEGGLLVTIPAAVLVLALGGAIRRNLRDARRETRGYWIRVGAAVGMVAIGLQEISEFSLQIPVNALLFCTLAALALAPVSRDTITVTKDA